MVAWRGRPRPREPAPSKKAGAFQLRLLVGRFARINLKRVEGVSQAGVPRRSPEQKRNSMRAGKLRSSSRTYRQIPHLRQHARHLHAIQLVYPGKQFRDERVFDQVANLFLTIALAARKQVRNGHFQRPRQPLQRRKRRRGLLILDFRNVSPRYRHASRQLPLAQAAAQAQRSNRRCQIEMAAPIAIRGHHLWLGHGRNNFRLVLVQRSVAPPAKIVGSTELNQQAMIAADNFPGIYRGKCSGHLGVGVARAGASPGTKTSSSKPLRNLRYHACGCQGKSAMKRETSHGNHQTNQNKPGETGRKP